MKHTLKESAVLSAKGFCMGAADVVPGVSGGTMALILGIYQRWLLAIKSFDSTWLQHIVRLHGRDIFTYPHFHFVIPLLLGIIAAVLFFTRIIPLPELLHTHPEPIYGLFFGLIVGSIIALLRDTEDLNWQAYAFMLSGMLLGAWVVNLVPMNTPDAPWFIFLCGFIAISAMLLPGISGSFLLLILRKYDTIMSGIGHFDVSIIIPFALGALTGVVVFSRVLSWLLAHYYRQALLLIIGVLAGSLWVIWPFQQREYIIVRGKERLIASQPQWPMDWNMETGLAIGLALAGVSLVLWLHRLSAQKTSSR